MALNDTALDKNNMTPALHTSNMTTAIRAAEASGYQPAGLDNLLGRCQADCTLFLEFDPVQGDDSDVGLVRAWIVDVNTFEFLGKTYEVTGPWAAAAAQARHLIEEGYAQERLSGGIERSATQDKEALSVD